MPTEHALLGNIYLPIIPVPVAPRSMITVAFLIYNKAAEILALKILGEGQKAQNCL